MNTYTNFASMTCASGGWTWLPSWIAACLHSWRMYAFPYKALAHCRVYEMQMGAAAAGAAAGAGAGTVRVSISGRISGKFR